MPDPPSLASSAADSPPNFEFILVFIMFSYFSQFALRSAFSGV